MARLWYGGMFADLAVSQGAEAEIYDPASTGLFGTAALLPIEAVTFTVYTNSALTVPTSDLLDADNAVMAAVTPEVDDEVRGTIPRFQGPDGYAGPLWLSADGAVGYRCEPESDLLYDRIAPIESDVTALEADIDAVEASVVSLDGRLDTLEAVPTVDFQKFTADGTWTKPAGAKRVLVEVQAAGGAGGGCATTGASQAAEGAGGGGGGFGAKWFDAASLAATVAVVVGVGGTGVSNGTGNTGEDSSFGSHFSAIGGTGGAAMAATGGPLHANGGEGGGVADLGTGLPPIVRTGGDGGAGVVVATGFSLHHGKGGWTRYCGAQHTQLFSSDGQSGMANSGSGGSGAYNAASQGSARTGGAGTDGVVFVTTFF